MQPIKQLARTLSEIAADPSLLFTAADLRSVVPGLSSGAFRVLLSRAVATGLLRRVCRGVYQYRRDRPNGLLLYHVAARLRADCFNYLSLESVLSDAGVISQILMDRITVMSSARSLTVNCGDFGRIEFVHTHKRPTEVMDELSYDARCRLWRASVPLAIRDMKAARRSLDLIDWSVVNEPV